MHLVRRGAPLSHDFAFALRFAKLDFDQATKLNRYEIPGETTPLT